MAGFGRAEESDALVKPKPVNSPTRNSLRVRSGQQPRRTALRAEPLEAPPNALAPYAIKHALTPEVAYESLPKARRRRTISDTIHRVAASEMTTKAATEAATPVRVAHLPRRAAAAEALFFRAGDASALADSLREVARDPDAAEPRAAAATRRYAAYRWELQAARYAQLLERVAAGAPAAPGSASRRRLRVGRARE
jgi:hypothetical protein